MPRLPGTEDRVLTLFAGWPAWPTSSFLVRGRGHMTKHLNLVQRRGVWEKNRAERLMVWGAPGLRDLGLDRTPFTLSSSTPTPPTHTLATQPSHYCSSTYKPCVRASAALLKEWTMILPSLDETITQPAIPCVLGREPQGGGTPPRRHTYIQRERNTQKNIAVSLSKCQNMQTLYLGLFDDIIFYRVWGQ